MDEPLRFVDKHRIQVGLDIVADGGRLRVAPGRPGPGWNVMLGMLGILVIGFALVYLMDPGDTDPLLSLLFIGTGFLVVVSILGIFRALAEFESDKGPVLEIDRSSRLIALPREGREIPFADVAGVALLIGDYEWTDGYEEVGELSLIVADESGGPTLVPVVMLHDARQAKRVANQVAALLDRPLRHERLGRGVRQPRVDPPAKR